MKILFWNSGNKVITDIGTLVLHGMAVEKSDYHLLIAEIEAINTEKASQVFQDEQRSLIETLKIVAEA